MWHKWWRSVCDALKQSEGELRAAKEQLESTKSDCTAYALAFRANKAMLAERDRQLFDCESKGEAGYDKAIEELRVTKENITFAIQDKQDVEKLLIACREELRATKNTVEFWKVGFASSEREIAEALKVIKHQSNKLDEIRRIYDLWDYDKLPFSNAVNAIGDILKRNTQDTK